MFSLMKQVFIVLLSFCESFATKCCSLNNESCMVRSTLTDLNAVELKKITEVVMPYFQKYFF